MLEGPNLKSEMFLQVGICVINLNPPEPFYVQLAQNRNRIGPSWYIDGNPT